jgi:hypothetical protein
MSFIAAAIVGGATLASGVLGSSAAKSAARTQANAARDASDLQYKQWQESIALQEPWRKAGEQALNKLAPLMDYQKFGMGQFQADPGYAFRLSEGQRALDRQAAARGGLMSGAALKGAQRFGQEMGSQEYQNAFNRYQTERAAQLQPLQSMAGLGQTTAQQVGASGQVMAQNVGDLMTSGAAARASGYVGSANALTNALGTGLNYYQNQQMLNRLPSYSSPQQSWGNLNQQYFTGTGGIGD